jgi:hypothetical protein
MMPYSPGKRGPRAKKEKLAEEMEGIRMAIAETAQQLDKAE